MGYKVKRIMVGDKQVRPPVTVVECDFTSSDYGFTYYGKIANYITYGRNSNGFYGNIASSAATDGVARKTPSSIIQMGEPKKIEITVNGDSTGSYFSIGLSKTIDGNRFRFVWDKLQAKRPSNTTAVIVNASGISANTDYIYTVDLENGIMSMTNSNLTLTIPSAQITSFYSDWNNGNVNIALCLQTDSLGHGATGYIKKAKFYF